MTFHCQIDALNPFSFGVIAKKSMTWLLRMRLTCHTPETMVAYGGKIRMLTMIDEFTRRCLTIHCARRIGSVQAIEQLANAMIANGIPEYIRSDHSPEFIAKELRSWLSGIGVKTAYIEPGSP